MSHAIGIVACHPRADDAHALADTVGAVYTSVDNGQLGCDKNHRKTWQWLSDHAGDATHLVVIEDDAVPGKDFTHQLDAMLTASPYPVVGLYLGTGYPTHLQSKIRTAVAHADVQGASFITTDALLHGVGIAIKTDLVADMLTYQDNRPFDYRIRNWANTKHHTIALCYPSLLDHADQDSLVKHPDGAVRTQPRKAWKLGGRNTWTSNTVTM